MLVFGSERIEIFKVVPGHCPHLIELHVAGSMFFAKHPYHSAYTELTDLYVLGGHCQFHFKLIA